MFRLSELLFLVTGYCTTRFGRSRSFKVIAFCTHENTVVISYYLLLVTYALFRSVSDMKGNSKLLIIEATFGFC